MRFPIQVTRVEFSDMNWHGPNSVTKTRGFSVVRLRSCRVPAWRFIKYGSRGQWWHFDIFFRGFRA